MRSTPREAPAAASDVRLLGRGLGPKTPGRAFLVATLVIFAAECLTMGLLNGAPVTPGSVIVSLVDATALLAVTVPLLYALFVRPMTRVLDERTRSARALRKARDELESRVEARTAELAAANRLLRAEAEERIRANGRVAFQAGLLDAIEQAVVATGVDGNVSYWNRYSESFFGWTEEEVLGRRLADVTSVSAECGDDVLSPCGPNRGWGGEVRLVRRDGGGFPAYLTRSPIGSTGAGPLGFVYVFLDITQRKQAEDDLRYSEQKYSTLVESSPTGIFLAQGDRLLFVNPELAHMLECSRSDLVGAETAVLVHPDDLGWVREIARSRSAGEAVPEEYECRLLTKAGRVRWANVRATLIPYRGGVVTLGNMKDVTDRRAMAEQLRAKTQALRHLSARLLTAQEDERQRVAADLHDSIGQSLSAIKFVVERALEGGRSDEPSPQFLALRSAVPLIQGSVDEVRRISMALRPSTLDDLGLVATIAWFTREFQATYPHIHVDREVAVGESSVPEVLKTSIFRILQEAMNNVAKHSRAEKVAVTLRRDAESLELVIRDDGEGFEPAAERVGGASGGFGFASMRERAELFGGAFAVVSGKGQGTEVTARWPLREAPTS